MLKRCSERELSERERSGERTDSLTVFCNKEYDDDDDVALINALKN